MMTYLLGKTITLIFLEKKVFLHRLCGCNIFAISSAEKVICNMLYAYYNYRHFYFLAPALDYTVDSFRPLYYFVPVCYFEISPEATSTCAEDY